MPTLAASQNILYQPYATDTAYAVLQRMPDPDLLLQKLGMGRHDLRKLETDDEISAAMDTRRDIVIGTPWRLDPYEESKHQWLWDAIAPHIEPLLAGAWQAVPYGYSVIEVVLRKGSPITIDHLSEKPLEWFEPTSTGELYMTLPRDGRRQAVPSDGKFILTRRLPTYRQPYGHALLSRCYWPWFFRTNGWEFWMRFLNRFSDPLLLGQVDDPGAFVESMQRLGFLSLIGVGREEKITAVTSDSKDAFAAVEQALLARIQKTWLGQTLTSQMTSSGGSYAAAKVHNEVRKDKRDSDLRLVEKAGQTLVNLLWRVNGAPGLPPQFRLQDPRGLDRERADRDSVLVGAGILSLTERYVQSRYDLEPGDFVIPAPRAPGTPQEAPGTQVSLSHAFAPAQRFTADQALLESLVEGALEATPQPVPAELIRLAISEATDPQDLQQRLGALYTRHDPAEFRAVMERALFTADVMGYSTAEKRIGEQNAGL